VSIGGFGNNTGI